MGLLWAYASNDGLRKLNMIIPSRSILSSFQCFFLKKYHHHLDINILKFHSIDFLLSSIFFIFFKVFKK
jgi:hypothetical protein